MIMDVRSMLSVESEFSCRPVSTLPSSQSRELANWRRYRLSCSRDFGRSRRPGPWLNPATCMKRRHLGSVQEGACSWGWGVEW